MKSLLLIAFLLLSFTHPKDTANSVLKRKYDRYKGSWYRTLKFIQETEKYRNDSLLKKETWYETMVYPDLFRIDFGRPVNGNAVIFANDSAWFFKDGKLSQVKEDHNDLIFLLGGIYFAPSFEAVTVRLAMMHYDLNRFHKAQWKGKEVYVIGASNDAERINQLWIDEDNFNIVRFLKFDTDEKTEGVMENHVAIGGGWTETKVTFYHNDQLVQVEKYHDYIANDSVDMRMFVPTEFGNHHWYKE